MINYRNIRKFVPRNIHHSFCKEKKQNKTRQVPVITLETTTSFFNSIPLLELLGYQPTKVLQDRGNIRGKIVLILNDTKMASTIQKEKYTRKLLNACGI